MANPGYSPLRFLVTLSGVTIIVFHLYAWLLPSGINWGVHHLAFLPPVVSASILLLMIAALVPGVQTLVLAYLDRWSVVFASRKMLLWSVLIVFSGLLFWVLRQQTFFLGDGYLAIRNLSLLRTISDIPTPFPTAPLSAFLAYQIKGMLVLLHVGSPAQLAWQILSVVSGVCAIPIAFKLAGKLSANAHSTALIAIFFLANGAVQLFFGYVETYPPAYLATMLFLWLSMEFLNEKVSIIVPSIVFGVLCTFHFGMLYLAPAVCVLYVVAIRRKGLVHSVLALAATKLVAITILWMCGYTLTKLIKVLSEGGAYFLPLSVYDNWQAAYSLLSGWHVVDLLNAGLLLHPFVIVLLPVAILALVKSHERLTPKTIFLSLALLGAAGWMVMTNFEVGISRDWDVLAPLSVCVVAFILYGWQHAAGDHSEKNRLIVGMAMITLLHTAAWVMVNASEERSIDRYVMLQDNRVRSQRAIAYACEDLAGFYRDRKQYAEAIPYLEQTVTIDSTNARRWLSLANVYQLAGQTDQSMDAYEQSIKHGIHDKAAFFNLGVLYYNASRIDEAIASLQRAAAIDSADTLISSNLRLMLSKRAATNPTKQ